MDTPHSYSHTTPSFATAVDAPNVLDTLCAALDHRLDALPDLLDVFAGKNVLNKELTGQLHHTTQEEVPVCLALFLPLVRAAASLVVPICSFTLPS